MHGDGACFGEHIDLVTVYTTIFIPKTFIIFTHHSVSTFHEVAHAEQSLSDVRRGSEAV